MEQYICSFIDTISIHAPREGSDHTLTEAGYRITNISIHAPREGSDRLDGPASAGRKDFYPRSPRGERPRSRSSNWRTGAFLSTLPARGATSRAARRNCRRMHFYPRSPRGERRCRPGAGPGSCGFLSTLPARGATGQLHQLVGVGPISIHAPREGSDSRVLCSGAGRGISIHAPREGSDVESAKQVARDGWKFLSTLPARGATRIFPPRSDPAARISIHAPREGSDVVGWRTADLSGIFLSTLPARGATLISVIFVQSA